MQLKIKTVEVAFNVNVDALNEVVDFVDVFEIVEIV